MDTVMLFELLFFKKKKSPTIHARQNDSSLEFSLPNLCKRKETVIHQSRKRRYPDDSLFALFVYLDITLAQEYHLCIYLFHYEILYLVPLFFPSILYMDFIYAVTLSWLPLV